MAGKDKGKKGKIIKLLPKLNKAIVSDINKVKKHQKPGNNEPGGIVEKEMPIHLSNLNYFDSKSNKGVRIGFKLNKDGKKLRINKKTESKFSMSRLLEKYKTNIIEDLKSKLSVSNIHQVPKISKIVINMGIGDAKDDTKLIDKAQEELSLISGQKAIKTKAKKAIAGFKIRAGMPLRLFSDPKK